MKKTPSLDERTNIPEDNIAEIGGNPRRFGNLISGIRRTSTITATSVSV
jgi:hypothetical protein